MLVKIYKEDGEDAVQILKFDTPPQVGDQVELDGKMFQVKRAWHQPTDQWTAETLAISLSVGAEPRPHFGGSWA